MSSNNISIRPGNDGIVDLPGLNVSSVLYIKGKKFEDYITELVLEDQFEQAEITELKLLVQYLDTSGLNSAWLVDNQNKNQDLKTAITALQAKLAQIDTTALTESSVLTNDNRNSVLKTRIDGHDGNLSSLTTKTQYLTSVVGSNGDPRTPSTFNVTIGDREKRQLLLTTGNNYINCQNDSTNQAEIGNYADNKIQFISQTGMVQSIAHFNSIQCIDKLEITGFAGMGIQSSPNIIIGNKGAQIKIGSEDTPEINSTNTIIQIGKRTITRNTETRLQGNIKIVDARFDELSLSSALTYQQFLSLISPTGIPAWVASSILSSIIPNYVFSDLWAMKGQITKDGDVETINTPKLKGYTVYDNTIDIDILPKVTTFIAKGDISSSVITGSIRQQVFNGEILLRNNNILATNINWALTEAGDKVNQLKISNNDIELTAGAGALNSQIRISNTTGGRIRFRGGTATGLQSNAHDAMSIFSDQASTQVVIAGNDAPTGYDTTTKLLVDHQNLANGIKITNHQNALVTRVNHNNINTPSLTLQTNFTGTTTKSVYLNANDKLMYAGAEVTPVSNILASGNIGVSSSSGIYTITNTAPVQSVVAGSGINVVVANNVATISAAAQQITDTSDPVIMEGSAIQRKPAYYGASWSSEPVTTLKYFDVYVSGSSKHIAFATRTSSNTSAGIVYSNNEGTNFNEIPATNGRVHREWISICGTTTADRIWFVCNGTVGQFPFNQIWVTTDLFTTMTLQTAPSEFANNNLVLAMMRCSGDGRYHLITEGSGLSSGSYPRVFKSSNSGSSWTNHNLAFVRGWTHGCAMSGNGQYQFVCVDGTSGGAHADTGCGGVYRSTDYGATFTRTLLPVNSAQIRRIDCNSSGMIVVIADCAETRISYDYGATWLSTGLANTLSVSISSSGSIIWYGFLNGSLQYSLDFGRTFIVGNTTPLGSVPAVSWFCISTNSDGSIVMAGNTSNNRRAQYREYTNIIRNLSISGGGLSILDDGNGSYALSSTSAQTSTISLGYTGFTTTKLTFSFPNVNLYTQYIVGRALLYVTADFDYGCMQFNDAGAYAINNNTNELSYNNAAFFASPTTSSGGTTFHYQDRSIVFQHIALNNNNTWILLDFTIDLMISHAQTLPFQLVCRGRFTNINKSTNQNFNYYNTGYFERISEVTILNSISFGNHAQNSVSVMGSSHLLLNVFQKPNYTTFN